MLFSKIVSCQVCHKKIKKSELKLVETHIGTKIYCCDKCIDFIKKRY